jgi:hypothetical protein
VGSPNRRSQRTRQYFFGRLAAILVVIANLSEGIRHDDTDPDVYQDVHVNGLMATWYNFRKFRESWNRPSPADAPRQPNRFQQPVELDLDARIQSVRREITRLRSTLNAPAGASPSGVASDDHHLDRLRADREALRAQLTYYGFLFSYEELRALQSEVEGQKRAITELAASCAATGRELDALREKSIYGTRDGATDPVSQRSQIAELRQRIHVGVALHRRLKDERRDTERPTPFGDLSPAQLRERLAAARAKFEEATHELQVLEDRQLAEIAELTAAAVDPALAAKTGATIRIKGFTRQIDEGELTRLLVRFGPLESVQVTPDGPNFVARAVFARERSAQTAVLELNGRRYECAALNVHLEFSEEMTDLSDVLQMGSSVSGKATLCQSTVVEEEEEGGDDTVTVTSDVEQNRGEQRDNTQPEAEP